MPESTDPLGITPEQIRSVQSALDKRANTALCNVDPDGTIAATIIDDMSCSAIAKIKAGQRVSSDELNALEFLIPFAVASLVPAKWRYDKRTTNRRPQ
jgi:hypothetical protein